MISSKRNFIFVHIPKTGGSSVGRAFRKEFDRENRAQRFVNSLSKRLINKKIYEYTRFQPFGHDHATAAQYLNYFGDQFWQMKSFSCIRNPYDLLVSLFFYMQQYAGHPNHARVQGLSFRDFVLQTYNKDQPENFQSRFLVDSKNRRLVQKIGRLETINESFKEIAQHLGLKAELPHSNKSKHDSYLQYYDDETIDLVATVFQQDFDFLGYSPDPQRLDFQPINLEPHPKLKID